MGVHVNEVSEEELGDEIYRKLCRDGISLSVPLDFTEKAYCERIAKELLKTYSIRSVE